MGKGLKQARFRFPNLPVWEAALYSFGLPNWLYICVYIYIYMYIYIMQCGVLHTAGCERPL